VARMYDDKVLEAIRSGVATQQAIAKEFNIPAGTMKQIMARLLKAGQIEVVTKGWYRARAEQL
jgi:Mn-dependent DtxR family transcriptional regulator